MEVGKTRPEIKKNTAGNRKPSPERELKDKIKRALLRNRKSMDREEIEFLLKRL